MWRTTRIQIKKFSEQDHRFSYCATINYSIFLPYKKFIVEFYEKLPKDSLEDGDKYYFICTSILILEVNVGTPLPSQHPFTYCTLNDTL